jgi:hypothetical protein
VCSWVLQQEVPKYGQVIDEHSKQDLMLQLSALARF